MADKRKLLVIDDEPDIGAFVRDVALDVGYDAVAAHLPGSFEQIYSDDLDVIVLDLIMPGRDGVELLRIMAEQRANASIILISGYDTGVLHSAQKLASEQGLHVVGTLTKPIRYTELEEMLNTIAFPPRNKPFDAIEFLELPTEQELHLALSNGELEPFFQPQLRFSNNSLIGVEALIRWRHPDRGLLGPNIIIPLAEQSGLMDKLAAEVLQQSFKQAAEWLRAGLKTRVAINMAPCNFKDLDLPEWMDEKIRQYGLGPDQITLEVTETTLMQELIKSLDILTRLRMKQVKLSIDDFGTGYSSLVQLHRIPFSEIKIDKSFVMRATADKEALAIVKMTILLGHELGMKVVGEGIEDQATWDLLAGLGCDVAQGYFIAKPMPGWQLLEWAMKQNKSNLNH
ncbi:GGDEF/EAL domain-containing response regulator [endosymbiont of Ridgeia piscesae]|jgi:EAL domain-containing protein (putative c-di-GMP-specific phosphodiesterase class I)|uniref:EAL domain, c-di-GMP-specific phosphodiesterase class I (Or its enzymatically inactive variant) n=1 Tax=endosymbiont of Ridgeia piscesae TaxID=54398 RepID=A0A0T5ZAG8_9GAMM|nr:EAL domain-containing response regulator [endosymbiont of Ridgeia piscesae]KRT55231.1 EAL domain, c-di-GMP-specific phosphodiesterase class I (or its enzymatically inactive variant) [endosymbiont of Ridgeia piscesae]KRT59509.1 EAL domain, c-di-GMP-specific phosphodiesterase class I (or its enzymatically inactive variant) [endosymbiont of Ridgeia piscesae]